MEKRIHLLYEKDRKEVHPAVFLFRSPAQKRRSFFFNTSPQNHFCTLANVDLFFLSRAVGDRSGGDASFFFSWRIQTDTHTDARSLIMQ